ncbi:Activating signal cointegrator 1 complex subunit [Fasciola hepatica]|uniref:Activating signal cointegrator 1 complex subunit n=1 Tax=Fasciola hepatica TaxID=6192 RepID=A0A4E0REG3_FASHE|nr:Activating signal cointegrator 1 complex subunit [Fasciola hepatica]
MVVITENPVRIKPDRREFPRLTSALRRLGTLTQPNFDDTETCCSIETKRAFLAGASFENYSSLKSESLWGRLSSLLPSTVSLERKRTLERSVHQYIDSCVDLVGRDVSSVNVFASHATLLCFGRLGPKVIDLLSRGVSSSDLSRHYTVQKMKDSILSELGGTGARNPDEVWNKIFSNLGNLLSHPLMATLTQDILDVMRQCRVAIDLDENPSGSAVLGPMSLVENSKAVAHRRQLALKSLDWDSAKVAEDELDIIAGKLLETLSGSTKYSFGGARLCGTDDISVSHTDSFQQMDVVRQAFAAPLHPGSSSAPSTSSTPLVDWTVLAGTLSAKAKNLGMPVEQIVDMVFTLLDSGQSDETVQNELCELIGWDYVELIFDLLSRRDEWIAAYRDDPCNETDDRIPKHPTEPKKPDSITAQIVNNPGLLAQARATQLKANARETAMRLKQAMQSGPSASTRAAEFLSSLPYVFDTAAQIRGTVGQSDLRLPLGTQFQQCSNWDHVQFPIPNPPPTGISDTPRVKISSLDRIGQQVFAGMEQLNLIQSVVFPTAYNTSENLLVSAPTGAGKTNVALLTIVQLLRSHLNADLVLDLKAFKIIYLAPMKALAAEMASTFGKRLSPLGLKVRECTGDMQLTKQEILETQMLVSTPEKWDVISRKGSGDATLVKLVKLLIIDEIHLLHEDRGAVIEVLVARTLRQVETSQTMIRLVGLSATLPNYIDVAQFLHVNLHRGLFYFDDRFRPVPLHMSFVGVRGTSRKAQDQNMNEACYEKVLDQVKNGEQVMVFVHARGDTVRTARWIRDQARMLGHTNYFRPTENEEAFKTLKKAERSSDLALRDLIPDGFACHHAGMLRPDRSLVERLFASGLIRTLVCTSTLAWGVNLPAHAVVIRGTRVYKAEQSDFTNLDVLDVLQIFGRAGRPQFDRLGVATIITTKDMLDYYLRRITNQHPIESTLLKNLHDHLNAEIALGTVTSLDDAVTWLKDTYLFIRLVKNPLYYGIQGDFTERDPDLSEYLRHALKASAMALDEAEMIRFEPATGKMASTDRGRTASLYYIRFTTASMVKDALEPAMLVSQLFSVLSDASEFASMKVRDEEGTELNELKNSICRLNIEKSGTVDADVSAKVNALLQGYISRHQPSCHSLASDMNYIHQNAGRVVRYLFEISLRQGWAGCASSALQLARMIEQRQWDGQTPLWQFCDSNNAALVERVDSLSLSVDRIRETDVNELAHLLHSRSQFRAAEVSRMASYIPQIQIIAETQPITRTILRVRLQLTPDFTWSDRFHGMQQNFWVWIEDPDQGMILHSEYWTLTKRVWKLKEPISLNCTIPLFEPFPACYLVRVTSDQWLGQDSVSSISFKRLILPPADPPHTDLLNLEPLSVTALQNSRYEMLYKFTHFNPIQTQIFHTLYHQDVNVLLGAPTGSGKTVAAELAIFRVFNETPKKKCVYIAPLKALVRERIEDWSVRIGQTLGKRVVELTGDVTPDIWQLMHADLIVTTPEKWDGISRSWQQRVYVRHIALIIIDEIHLLGEERGPVLEVLVSRANFIANQLGQSVRVVGLSTALSNAPDLASWLRVPTTMTSIAEIASASTSKAIGQVGRGLFNFRPSVRPVPLEVHVQGYSGRHYCPRMATMNRPIFSAINSHSPTKPVLVFVSSRRQTRLTALDLVSFIAATGDSKRWLHMETEKMDSLISTVQDVNLRLTLSFGIGLHHAGLQQRDRSLVEELFVNQKIQILIATSTLAWGVNFPAHLVIVKGTEYYDGKTKRYVDYPITDVLQMMGRAGRPQFDNQGKAVIMVQDTKKTFYKRFLYEPFPVESCLLQVLPDHLNAEIVAGTIGSMQEALDYLTWTFFFRRLMLNPSYYGLTDCSSSSVSAYLSQVVLDACNQLISSHCIQFASDRPDGLVCTEMGRLASFYYLSHKTILLFIEQLRSNATVHDLLAILANAHEYALLPVRHNEDEMNEQLSKFVPLPVIGPMECPHTKTHLLLQAHFSRLEELPVADYVTDTRSVLDQAARILQAMLDTCTQCGWLTSSINCLLLMQMITQGLWVEDAGSGLLQLPGLLPNHLMCICRADGSQIDSLPELLDYVADDPGRLNVMLQSELRPRVFSDLKEALRRLPVIEMSVALIGPDPTSHVTKQGDGQTTRLIRLDEDGRSCGPKLAVFTNTDYVLRVHLTRLNPSKRASGGGSQLATYSNLVKAKTQDGWVLILGKTELSNPGGELLALKRVPPRAVSTGGKQRNAICLAFRLEAGDARMRTEHNLTLYLFSDSYLGLDQQIELRFESVPSENAFHEDEDEDI